MFLNRKSCYKISVREPAEGSLSLLPFLFLLWAKGNGTWQVRDKAFIQG